MTRYHDLIEVVSDPQTFVNGEGTQIPSRKVEGSTSTVHNTDPPRHTKLRKLVIPHLRAVKIREWQDVMDAAVSTILDSVSGRADVELVQAASALLPIQVLGQVLGIPIEDCGLLLDCTTRNLITGTVLAFDQFPGEWDRLVARPDLLRPAIEEMLRFITPIRAMRRATARDVEFGGQQIRAGDKVVCWFQAANRDPAVFADPDVVRIDCTPNDRVGSAGASTCLGSHLARAEITTFPRLQAPAARPRASRGPSRRPGRPTGKPRSRCC